MYTQPFSHSPLCPPSLMQSEWKEIWQGGETPSHCIQNKRKREEEGLSPPGCIQNERKCDKEGLPPPGCIQNERKHDKEGLTPPGCIQNERKCDEEGLSLSVAFKMKGNTMRGKIPPHHICHFCWVDVVEKGKMGGCTAGSSCWGVRYWKRIFLKWRTLYACCPFPAPSLLYPAPFRVVVVHHLCLVALLVVGQGRQVMVRDGDVATDRHRELWGRAWESGLREISNNGFKLTRADYLSL